MALLDGDVTLRQFDPKRFTSPDILGLLTGVKVHLDDALTPRYPRGIPNRITVKLKDGRQFVKEVEFPRGHNQNPMTDAEVEHKFRTLVEPRYSKAMADQVLAACWKLEELKSVTELLGRFAK